MTHLHTITNASATRAKVYLANATGKHFFANVSRANGFWHVNGTSGVRLLPLIPHTEITAVSKNRGNTIVETPMGVIIKRLSDRVRGVIVPVAASVATPAISVGV